MNLTPIEFTLVSLLVDKGVIRGTAQVGYALWPERKMQPQGAALAAGKVLRGLRDRGLVASYSGAQGDGLSRYEVTKSGRTALATAQQESVESRQLKLM